ncbi:hypothetical protein LJB92_01875 [Bacteroidales bacterium OttesenSCG-928-M06]|nr:hypothetical protein [Bacteroidales bacterium OttesenSCG-928-M06]
MTNINSLNCKLEELEIRHISSFPSKYSKDKEVATSVNFKFGFTSFEESHLGIILRVIVAQNNDTLMGVELFGAFEIEKNDWKKMIVDDKLIIPSRLAQFMLSTAYDSARGVFLHKNMKNELHKINIPLLKAERLIKKDVIFE